MRFYGLDLRRAVEDLPPRRLWALIDGLPPEGALGRHRTGGWTEAEHMLATLIETTDYWGRAAAVIGGAKADSLPKPIRFTRPGMEPEEPERKVVTDPAVIRAWFARNA